MLGPNPSHFVSTASPEPRTGGNILASVETGSHAAPTGNPGSAGRGPLLPIPGAVALTPKERCDGTHRLVSPEETFARLRPLLSALGITRVANVTGLDRIGIPVVMVTRPNSRSLSVSQGKGQNLASARVSGVMESVEMFHAERIALPLRFATLQELVFTLPLLDVSGLARFSVSTFHANLRLLWIEGRDLLANGSSVWLPYEVVHTDYTLPLPAGSGSFFMSSSGLASGNHPLEAISHALCELIERDAVTLWHHRPEAARQATRIDLASVDDPGCRALLEKYERAGVDVAVWDTTSDVGLPTFFCTIVDREDSGWLAPPASGSGCHPTRAVALSRALTEAAQSRLTVIAGSRDDVRPEAYEPATIREAVRLTRLQLRHEGPLRRFGEVPSHEAATFDEDVTWTLERLRACGLRQVALVDLTRPELGIPVVRAVIPGLESLHDAPGYSPGPRARRLLQERAS